MISGEKIVIVNQAVNSVRHKSCRDPTTTSAHTSTDIARQFMISGVILARNEASNIVECIKTLRPHVAEIILIDMESDDDTIELALPLVDRILSHPIVAMFDAARNIAIPEAQYDWFWFVDADERIPARTGELVVKLIREQSATFEALIIPFKTYFCGQWMQHCGWWPGYTMPRVLKRGSFKFAQQLHAGVELNGRQISLPPDPTLAIDHFSYRNIEHYLEKLNRYTSTEASHLMERGISFDWRESLRHMIADLWSYYEANRGVLDGERGWILSWLSGQYRWLSHAKLIDLNSKDAPLQNNPSIPNSLDEVLEVMDDQLLQLRKRNPRIPFGIIWRSPVWDPSGYADECRTFLKALARGSRHLRLEDIRWSSQECQLPVAEAALFRALTRVKRPRFSAAITDCIPTTCAPDPRASINILRTTFETDRIPSNWLPALEKYDEIWVTSQHNCQTFRRSGVAPEKLFAIPSCVDTERYRPLGPKLNLPESLQSKFVFLSVFDWAYRKGWDLLLKAYCQSFSAQGGTALLLKVTRSHLHPISVIYEQAEHLLASVGESLQKRPDILISDAILDAEDMAALYRSVQAFVLASRGEGWGRPYMEAMACGLPTIGTRATGNIDFMNDKNSFLVDAKQVDVPEEAAREIPVYHGHRWYEPDIEGLKFALRQVYENEPLRTEKSREAVQSVQAKFGLAAGLEAIESALARAEQRYKCVNPVPVQPHHIRVEWQGEFFAGHSFSKINEQIAIKLIATERVALSLRRHRQHPTFEVLDNQTKRISPYFERPLDGGPQIVVRHSYPPVWTSPVQGKWVHIQPWEYGQLPQSWIEPLSNRVDEIWVPSEYVRRVYIESGIAASKIFVIPWGVDPECYHPGVPAKILPTKKQFAFLFVGGTIARKGFDLLLAAFLEEFHKNEDVCLVIKDCGTNSYYSDSTHKALIQQAMGDSRNPEIVYYDDVMTEGQLASLYASCQCFVAPYRGEGFGLPILEAMSAGLMVIVPRGGASDDFVTDETGILLPAILIQEDYRADLGCNPSHLEVSISDLRLAMRKAFADANGTRKKGLQASQYVRNKFSWERTTEIINSRFNELIRPFEKTHKVTTNKIPLLTACVIHKKSEEILIDCLARLQPFVDQFIVLNHNPTSNSALISSEYGGYEIQLDNDVPTEALIAQTSGRTLGAWYFLLDSEMLLDDRDVTNIRSTLATQASEIEEVTLRLQYTKGKNIRSSSGLKIIRSTALPQLVSSYASPQAIIDDSLAKSMYHKQYGRRETIDKTLKIFTARHGKTVVEIGSIRERGNIEGDGYSTIAWAMHADEVYSIDINPAATALTQEETAEFGNTTAITCDGIEFLNGLNKQIDLLYLDAWDAHSLNSQENHLKAYLAARKNLSKSALILIDDTDLGDRSKGKLVIPQALKDGYSVLFSEGKQTLLGKI